MPRSEIDLGTFSNCVTKILNYRDNSHMDKLDGLVDQDSFDQLSGFFREAFGEAVYPQNLISAVNTLVTV